MNFTGGNTLPRIGRRINWQLVMLAGGLAAVISAAALAGAFERQKAPATTAVNEPIVGPPAPGSATAARTGSDHRELVYLVVGSQAEAATLQSAISTDAATIPAIDTNQVSIAVIAIETAQDEAELAAMIGVAAPELMSVGAGLRVVDLRRGTAPVLDQSTEIQASQPTVYIVSSQDGREALEQRLAESGEANFSIFVIERGSLEGDRLYNTLVGEQMESGNFNIIDLR